MPEATFWFASPFREWIGQRSLTVSWEGRITLREIWERLAADYPKVRANLPREGIQEEAMSHLTAVIVDGDILTLDAEIKDGAKVDVLTPLSGGTPMRCGMSNIEHGISNDERRGEAVPGIPLVRSSSFGYPLGVRHSIFFGESFCLVSTRAR